MEKEKLLRELEYVNSVIKDLRPNDGDSSFYYWQRDEIEKKIKECEEIDKQDIRTSKNEKEI